MWPRPAPWLSPHVTCLCQAMKGVTRMLGAKVWDYTLIGLTHGRVLPPTLDQTYGEAASHVILLHDFSMSVQL